MKNTKGRPKDINQLAKMIVDIATGQVEDTVSAQKKKESDAEQSKLKKKKK